jgi:hypothetical protein
VTAQIITQQKNFVILSEGARSLRVAVEGPAFCLNRRLL